MLTILMHNKNCGLNTLTEPETGCWINVIDPSPDEIKQLEELGIPHDYLTYPLDLDERARTERENGELLIILRIPHFQGEQMDIPYTTIPLGIILTDKYLLTVCKLNSGILQEIAAGRMKDLSTSKRNRFVLRLLLVTANRYLNYLREITKRVEELEDKLQLSIRNKEVLELLKYEKSLTYFTTALKSNELLMERLQRSQLFKMYPDDEDLLEDVLIENRQAIEMTNIESNILSSMMDAFTSIISNNLNAVIKLLTSVTLVLSLPAIVAGFYGMNVHMPFQNSAYAFPTIMLLSFGISLAAAFFLKKRDWF